MFPCHISFSQDSSLLFFCQFVGRGRPDPALAQSRLNIPLRYECESGTETGLCHDPNGQLFLRAIRGSEAQQLPEAVNGNLFLTDFGVISTSPQLFLSAMYINPPRRLLIFLFQNYLLKALLSDLCSPSMRLCAIFVTEMHQRCFSLLWQYQ